MFYEINDRPYLIVKPSFFSLQVVVCSIGNSRNFNSLEWQRLCGYIF